jgi:tape measure domain-containing protein
LSDSVANLTVKVDTKSVAAAIKALDALASKAGAVEKSVGNIGAAAKKASGGDGLKQLESWTNKSAGALAKLEARLEKGAREHEKITRLVNQHALSEKMRADTLGRVNRAFTEYNRVVGNSTSTTLQIDRATRQYSNTVRQLRDGIDSVVKLQNQKTKALKESEKEITRNASASAKLASQEIARQMQMERILQQAQTRVAGIIGRAGRQVSGERFAGISVEAQNSLDRYTSALRTYGLNTIGATTATGEFNRNMQRLSGDIARVGGLLPKLSDNARVISAAFGAANASLSGFSRILFNTNAAVAALGGAFAMRELTQSIMEFEKFSNTLRTVSATGGEFQRNMQFLIAEADRVGFSVGEVGNSFARLSLAMKGAGFSSDEARTSFTQLTEASRNFGLSSADTMGVIRALEQSMSKGKFMAEEVRLQLGDRLPIAMAALEKAVTKVDGRQADLNKRFEEGSIDVKRYGMEFINQINLMSGGADALARTSNSIAAAFGRLGTEFSLFANAIGEGGLNDAVITFSNSLVTTMQTLREIGATETIGALFKALADLVIFIINGLTEITRLLKAIGALDAINFLLKGFSSISTELTGLIGSANQLSSAMTNIGRVSKNTNDTITEFNEVLYRNKQGLDASSTAIERRIEANKRLGMSEADAIAAVAKAEAERLRIEAAAAQRELAKAERAYTTMRRAISPGARAVGTTLENIQTQLQAPISAEMRAVLQEQEQMYRRAQPIIEGFLNGTISATDSVRQLTTAFKDSEMPDIIDDIRKKINDASMDKNFNAAAEKVALARKEVDALRRTIEDFETRFANGITIQFNIDTIRQQEGGMRAATGSFADIEREAQRAISDTQSIAKKAEATRSAIRNLGLDKTAEGLDRFGDLTAKSDKELIKFLRTNETFRTVLPGVAKELDGVNIAEGERRQSVARSENSLEKYIDTLKAEIAAQDDMVQAYRQSTSAGEDRELALKAETEAIRLANGDEKKRVAILAQITPLLQKQAQGERDKEAAKGTTKQREDELTYLQLEKTLIGESVLVREQELAALRERQRLQGASPSLIADAEALARQTVRLRQENEYSKNSYEELGRIGERAFEQVGDAITEAFSKGEIRALNFGNIVRGVMSSILQSIIRLGVINPVLNSLFSGSMRPTLGAGLSGLGAGGAVAGAAGGGGGLMDLLGLSSLIPKEGILGSLGITGPGGLLSTPLWAGPAVAIEPSIAMGVGGYMAPSSVTLGGLLGGAGAGFGAGMFLNSMLGGNQTGGMVGSGLGSLAGAAIGSIIPGVGTLIGGLLGGAAGGGLGGLFGPGESDRGFGYAVRGQNGRLAMTDMFYNEQGRAQFQEAEAGINAINAYLQQRGLSVTGDRAVGGNRFGMGNLGYGEAASFSEAIASMNFAATANDELNRALSGRSFAGLEKLQGFVEGFISIQDTIKGLTEDPIPEFTQQMNALIDSFAQAAAKAREYGISEDDLNDARDAGIAKLEKQRALTIRDTALGLEIRRLTALGLDQQAEQIQLSYNTQKEIESFTASLDALALTAEEKSKMLVKLEEVQAEERAAIMRESTRGISDFLDSLRVGGLSGTTGMGRLASAGELFSRDLAAAQTGDRTALQRITQSSETYLNLAREIYGSTSAFHGIRSGVVSSLENLVSNPVGQQLLNISDVPFVKEMAGLGQTAFESASLEYNKQFNDKLESLLPIAEAIKTAVEKTADVQTYVAQQDFMFDAESGAGGFGGDMGGGGGMAAALGAALYHGKVMAYANGGIPDYVNSPTLAPMALFGEAGPEAIMPLRRGPDGRLGVEVNGGNTQAVVGELRAVRNAIESLEETVARNDADQGSALLEAVSGLQIQIGELREELRTSRLRAQ